MPRGGGTDATRLRDGRGPVCSVRSTCRRRIMQSAPRESDDEQDENRSVRRQPRTRGKAISGRERHDCLTLFSSGCERAGRPRRARGRARRRGRLCGVGTAWCGPYSHPVGAGLGRRRGRPPRGVSRVRHFHNGSVITAGEDVGGVGRDGRASAARRALCRCAPPMPARYSQAMPSPSRSSFVEYPGSPMWIGAAPAARAAVQFA